MAFHLIDILLLLVSKDLIPQINNKICQKIKRQFGPTLARWRFRFFYSCRYCFFLLIFDDRQMFAQKKPIEQWVKHIWLERQVQLFIGHHRIVWESAANWFHQSTSCWQLVCKWSTFTWKRCRRQYQMDPNTINASIVGFSFKRINHCREVYTY